MRRSKLRNCDETYSSDPTGEVRLRAQIGGERRDLLVREVADDALGEDEHLLRAGVDVGEERAARGGVAEIDGAALEPAAGRLVAQALVLEVDGGGEVDLDPAKRRRKLEAIGARVEAGAEVENGVAAVGDRLADEVVDDARAR